MNEIKSVRPDILDCLANLSSDEVFTPPKVVNEMLDMLPQDLFENPKTRFLDPFTKSGVFLREIVKRLDKGLVRTIPDKEDRLNHIFQRQVYGIACTQLTALFSRRSLYCNKNVQDKRSTAPGLFSTEAGNIGYHRCHHTWVNGSCKVCGASKKALSESKDVENYAYPFLHDEVFMKQAQELGFDVIIGNPPYQIKDGGGNGSSSAPIYHLFIKQALKLNPRYLSMIIPARWYSGGKGLDEFRDKMINDRRISNLVDYFDAEECFPGVDLSGGICYFLWDKEHDGMCKIISHRNQAVETDCRYLNEGNRGVFIRYSIAAETFRKVSAFKEDTFDVLVSSRRCYGLDTSYRGSTIPFKNAVKVYSSGGIGYAKREEVVDQPGHLKRWKCFVSVVYGERGDFPYFVIGKPFVGEPDSCCTDSYLSIGGLRSKSEIQNLMSYMRTRFFRYLVLLLKNTQIAPKKVYSFVPMQDFSKPWTDAELYKKYKLTDQEVEFIESMIRPME